MKKRRVNLAFGSSACTTCRSRRWQGC